MTFKRKATRVAALSLLLAPMALSTFQGVSNVYATGGDTTLPETVDNATINIHKLQFSSMPPLQQNTGNEMVFAGSTPLNGVSFEIFDITAAIAEWRASKKTVTDIANEPKIIAETADGYTVEMFGETKPAYLHTADTGATEEEGLVTASLPKKVDGKDAAYLIREISHPANVVAPAADMFLMFPVYAFDAATGKYTNTELSNIHLYPKNVTGAGDVLVNKVVQGEEGNIIHNGAKFVVKRIVDGTTEYMGPVNITTGARTWGGRSTAEEFTTTGNGQVSITNIPRSSAEAETFYLEEVDSGNPDITIPEQNRNLSFILDGTNVAGTEYDYIFAAGSIVNNDLVPEKTVSDIVLGNGESVIYEVAFNVPTDIDALVDDEAKYTNFFLLDEHHKALSLNGEASIEFYDIDSNLIPLDWQLEVMPSDNLLDMYNTLHETSFTELPEEYDYFGITFSNPAEDLADYAGQRIIVKYEMKLIGKEDVADVELLNTANIHTGYENDSSETEVFTGGKKFIKVDANTGAELDGAKFYVTKADGQALYLDADGLYTWADAPTITDGNPPTNLVVLESEDGVFEIEGLDYNGERNEAGDIEGSTTYTLMEFAAPSDRYILPADGFDFDVYYGSFLGEDVVQKVENREKGSLPSTGGTGTIVFFLVGAATMAGAAYVVRKNKKTA